MINNPPDEVASPTANPTAVSNLDFADQMRNERLDTILKLTGAVTTIIAWAFLLLGGAGQDDVPIELGLIAWLLITATLLISLYFLRRGAATLATWIYALGGLLTLAYLLYTGGDTVRQVVPSISLVIVYIVGLMLPIRSTVYLLPLNTLVIFGAPWLADGRLTSPSEGTWLAFLLSLVTAVISAQASGELYAIADWALENYRRERDGATKLYENRLELERSLIRQRGLTTELSTANDELALAQRAAEEAKHFRGQFLANMSHELRTPLNAVIGFSETMLNFPMMYNMTELPNEYRGDLEQIHNSGKHLLNIINDILDLSKIDAGRLEVEIGPVELEPIIKGVMSIAVGLVGGKPIKLTRETPEVIPLANGDPIRIRQIFLNVYSNAAKFTDQGSIKLKVTHDDHFITVSITDTGEGIHPKDIDMIFEEFRQGSSGRKRARAGSGLGMTITRQLLTLMGGNIWVESVLGEGSTFSFTLPRYYEPEMTQQTITEASTAEASPS
jgi:signal transduction histidine kinase